MRSVSAVKKMLEARAGSNPRRRKATGIPEPPQDPELAKYGIYEKTAPLPAETTPVATSLPLQLKRGDRIALIGNMLLERSQDFGNFEAMLQQSFPEHQLAATVTFPEVTSPQTRRIMS